MLFAGHKTSGVKGLPILVGGGQTPNNQPRRVSQENEYEGTHVSCLNISSDQLLLSNLDVQLLEIIMDDFQFIFQKTFHVNTDPFQQWPNSAMKSIYIFFSLREKNKKRKELLMGNQSMSSCQRDMVKMNVVYAGTNWYWIPRSNTI